MIGEESIYLKIIQDSIFKNHRKCNNKSKLTFGNFGWLFLFYK